MDTAKKYSVRNVTPHQEFTTFLGQQFNAVPVTI